MKRLLAVALVLLLCCVGCAQPAAETPDGAAIVPASEEETVAAQPNETPTEEAQPTEALATELPTDEPATEPQSEEPAVPQPAQSPETVLIDTFIMGEILDDEQTEGILTVYDLDGDGKDEEIGFSLDWDEETTTITDGSRSYVFSESPMLTQVLLADMDAASAYRNLIVSIDTGSDDYVTVVLHPEGDALVQDSIIDGFAAYEDGRLIIDERTGLLGSNSGTRAYFGDGFNPESEWLDCWTPSEESMLEDPTDLVDGGILLHLVRDLPIRMDDGSKHVIHTGTYIYLVRFHESRTMAEVSEMDGVIRGVVTFAYDEEHYTYTIDGVSQDDYFDNLFYAD